MNYEKLHTEMLTEILNLKEWYYFFVNEPCTARTSA